MIDFTNYLSLGAVIATSIVALLTIKSSKKKKEAEASTATAEATKTEAEASKAKFESYTLLIDDLNTRLASALSALRNLEKELVRVKKDYNQQTVEIAKLRKENKVLREEVDRLTKENTELKTSQDTA